jgi:hypothetical protein
MKQLLLGLVCLNLSAQDHGIGLQTARPSPEPNPIACTSLEYLLRGREVPKTPAQWRALLRQFGDVREAGIVFSDSPQRSNIQNPRYLLGMGPTKARPGSANPNLEKRLFLASNLSWDPKAKEYRATRIEFQTWNFAKRRFEFGIVENPGTDQQKISVVPIKQCNSCHKNEATLFAEVNWSNAASNEHLRNLLTEELKKHDTAFLKDEAAFGQEGLPKNYINLLASVPDYDINSRGGAQLNREAKVLRYFPASPQKTAFIHQAFLSSLANRMPNLDEQNRYIQPRLLGEADNGDELRKHIPKDLPEMPDEPFRMPDALVNPSLDEALTFAAAPPTLTPETTYAEFRARVERLSELAKNPTTPRFTLEKYNELQLTPGYAGISLLSPTRLYAFVPPPSTQAKNLKSLTREDYLFNLEDILLAKSTTGAPLRPAFLTSMGERAEPRLKHLVDAVFKKRGQTPTAEEWFEKARHILPKLLETPVFKKWIEAAYIPEEHEFIFHLQAAISEIAIQEGIEEDEPKPLAVDDYFKNCAVTGPQPRVGVGVGAGAHNHACARCHVGGGSSKPLPFDPFDVTAREAWLRTSDPKSAKAYLARLGKRVFKDRDMPPPDEDEARGFSLEAAEVKKLREFIERGLK